MPPVINGSNNKMVFYPNEQKPQNQQNIMNHSSNQYFNNIPNIFKRPTHDNQFYPQPMQEPNYQNNNSEMSFNYPHQSGDFNHNTNHMNGIERLFQDQNSQLVRFFLIEFLLSF